MDLRPIALMLCLGAAPAAAQPQGADPSAGERLFRARCASCHAVAPGQNRIGPSLGGVVGRKAGSVEGARYSQAMRDLGVVWDAANLDTYLANPRAMVKDTTMTIAVPSATDREALVGYLQSLSRAN